MVSHLIANASKLRKLVKELFRRLPTDSLFIWIVFDECIGPLVENHNADVQIIAFAVASLLLLSARGFRANQWQENIVDELLNDSVGNRL